MRALRNIIFSVLVFSAVGGLTSVAWQFRQLIEHHRFYMAREGMWPTVEEERTLLELRDAVVRISVGDAIASEDYQMRLSLAFSRAEIVRNLITVIPEYSVEQRQLVDQLQQQFDTYSSIEQGRYPDQATAKRLIPLLDDMVLVAHDLVNFRRDVAYQINRETFVNIDKLIVLLVITIGCLFASGIAFFSITHQTLRKDIEIAQLQRQAAEQEKEVAISRARVTMASELHDVLNYHLAIIAQKLSRAHDQLTTNSAITRKEILEARARSRLALRDVRGSIHALRSGNIQPLDQAIQALDAGGMVLHVEVLGQARVLPDDLAFAMYRITQEAVANTIKHAHQATSINVTLDFQCAEFGLIIADDGKALTADYQDERAKTSLGLIGMQERVEQLRGSFQHSSTGQGYYIQAIFPMEQASNDSDSRPDCGRSSNLSPHDQHQP